MFTIRVVLETIKPQNCLTCCSHECGQLILDTFVIVNGQIAFNKLVEFVLKDLGMPYLNAESKGLIQINNWKPLQFEQITDNLQQPITNLLKDISSNLTLKILTRKTDLKNPVSKNGFIKPIINSLNVGQMQQMRLPDPNKIQSTQSESPFLFQDNISEQLSVSDSSDNDLKETSSTNHISFEPIITTSTTAMKIETNEFNNNLPTSFFSEFANNFLNLPSTTSASTFNTNILNNDRESSPLILTPKHINNSSGRGRLMFDLLTEIPILEQWFQENPHPNWLQIEEYTNALNEQPYRKTSTTKMTNLNIKIWFKNRRAKSKRLIN
uniref:Homeobox domain-containing protein n=1 Tax=Panagrolaimus davidi TaxID=227884 RepID=A0A914Q4Y9_9BILA